jgi:hypothetical protein
MDLGLDTGLRNLPIVVKRMQRRQWGRIVPALLGRGRIESGWGITNLRLATTGFYGRTELGAGPVGRASGPAGRDPRVRARLRLDLGQAEV